MAKGGNLLFPGMDDAPEPEGNGTGNGKAKKKAKPAGPPNLGKAIRLPVPDFDDDGLGQLDRYLEDGPLRSSGRQCDGCRQGLF